VSVVNRFIVLGCGESGLIFNKTIAKTLDVAEGTVKLHVAAIMRSLDVRNRTHAVNQG